MGFNLCLIWRLINIANEEMYTFIFLILESGEETKMKNIPHSVLPIFHGLSKGDLDTFLFEFDVLYRSYEFVMGDQKFRPFPTTLKNAALLCFMNLCSKKICTWAQMKDKFWDKYQDYFKYKEIKEEVFRMTQNDDESLEEYIIIFNYKLKRSRQVGFSLEMMCFTSTRNTR